MKRALGFASIVVCALAQPGAQTAIPPGPTLYALPFHQSPVRADPDDLLTLAGYGLVPGSTVVYRRLGVTAESVPPLGIPPASTGEEGIAPVVSETAIPDNIVVKLPAVMRRDETYRLWVRTPAGVWSNFVTINDARPLWVSPARVPRSQAIATLPRELKVIGRNLQHAPNAMTTVRLVGPAIYEMQALDDGVDATAIERYVARVSLPPDLVPGGYQVRVSRDGKNWVAVAGQLLEVVADPPLAPPTVSIAAYDCQPNDDEDDSDCFDSAFKALAAGGGVVTVPAGTWDLNRKGVDSRHGLVVPVGVSLRGAGMANTRIVRGESWDAKAVFTLQGNTTVSDIFFDDLFADRSDRSQVSTHLQLGRRPGPDSLSSADDIVITRNRFERNDQSIGGGGLPVRRLVIAGNEFRAFKDALFLDNYYLPHVAGAQFALIDSIVSRNLFLPGAYETRGQGTIASQMGASLRVDFSENVADGHGPNPNPNGPGRPGWRAAFFFHQANNHEQLLISQNAASCTGDKAGDGEAIAYDHAVNTYAFDGPKAVTWADATRVRVRGPLLDSTPGAFVGHWIQIVDGVGVGQSRKIVGYRSMPGPNVEFTIDRPWEVVPFDGSRIVVTRQFWQSYIVDNQIDIRGCQKQNPDWPKSGEITIWAQTSDSAIEGNAQYESDGIKIFAGHSIYEPPPPPTPQEPNPPDVPRRVHFAYFLDVRSNTILDEYSYDVSDVNQNGSFSGIELLYWTLTGRQAAQVSYGVSLAHNTVAHADGPYGGAIALTPAFFGASSPPSTAVQLRSTVVHHNLLRDVQCSTPTCVDPVPPRVAINIHDGYVYDTVLYKNSIVNCRLDLIDNGTHTTRVQ